MSDKINSFEFQEDDFVKDNGNQVFNKKITTMNTKKTTGEAKKPEEKKYTFWKENKLESKYSLTVKELKEKYIKFLMKKDVSSLHYYGVMMVSAFVADKEGLNSVSETSDYEFLQNELKETHYNFLKEEVQMVLAVKKSEAMTDRFFLEEIVFRLSQEDFNYVEILTKDWMSEMVKKLPLDSVERKKFQEKCWGKKDSFHFKNEEELERELKMNRY